MKLVVFIVFLFLVPVIFANGGGQKCEITTCTVCENQKTSCPDTPGRQMDGHQKKMHECGEDCCLHTYIGDKQDRHTKKQQSKDHRDLPEYDGSKRNVNGKRPECKGEDDCCHTVAEQTQQQIEALNAQYPDGCMSKPECAQQCQQINQQCEMQEQQCVQKGRQAKQQYQQQKKGEEIHDQELNDCFERFQKTVEVEKGKQYDLTTPQVNDILDKPNKVRYVHDERTSGEHECEHLLLDDGNQYKNENIESFDEGKKKILDDTNDDVLRKDPQDEFMTPECIKKTMHEKEKPRLSERVFNAQCRTDNEPDKNCPIAADVVLARQAELNHPRHTKNIESAKKKTEELKKVEEKNAREMNGTQDKKKRDSEKKKDETIAADLAYLYFYDKEVSKKFKIEDKNPHRVARIRKNKEGKKPGMDKFPANTCAQRSFQWVVDRLGKIPLGLRDMPVFLANCAGKEIAIPGAQYGWRCAQPVAINPVQREEAEKAVENAKKIVFFSDHWQTEQGKLNTVTDQPAKSPELYTGAHQPYKQIIPQKNDIWFGDSIHIINKKKNMFTLDGWLNTGIIDHDIYYSLSPGGKTIFSFASPVGEFLEDGHARLLWVGPGTTSYLGDFFDRYTTNTNLWHFPSHVYLQQPDYRRKKKETSDPPAHQMVITFDKKQFDYSHGADIAMTNCEHVTVLAHGFFDMSFLSETEGIFPILLRSRALGDSDIVYNPGLVLLKSYALLDERNYAYRIFSYDDSTKVHTFKNDIIEDSGSKPMTTLTERERRLVYTLRQ